MSEAIPSLPNTPSWRGAQLKKAQGQLYLYLYTHAHTRLQQSEIEIITDCGNML
jgi:hypothetical protein